LSQPTIKDELNRVLDHYNLGVVRRAQRIEGGFVNDNWVIETTGGRFFLKRRHPDLRNPGIICFQHALVAHLRGMGFPAPDILPTRSGETFLKHNGEFYEIQEYIEGAPCEHVNPENFRAAAATLAHYHICVKDFAAQPTRDHSDLYDPAILAKHLTELKKTWEAERDSTLAKIVQKLESQAADLTARFAEHEHLPNLVIHGDYHCGNLLFKGNRIVGVVDYDKACWQPRILELAEALIYFASPSPGHLRHLVYPGVLECDKFASFLHHYSYGISSADNKPAQWHDSPRPIHENNRDCFPYHAILQIHEANALPDYIRCIWLSVSLQRLLEIGYRPTIALEALHEILSLGTWSAENSQQMAKICRSAIGRSG